MGWSAKCRLSRANESDSAVSVRMGRSCRRVRSTARAKRSERQPAGSRCGWRQERWRSQAPERSRRAGSTRCGALAIWEARSGDEVLTGPKVGAGSSTRRHRRVNVALSPPSGCRETQDVADAAHRLEEARLARVRLDGGAQPVDVHVHGPRLTRVVVAPDLLQELVAAEDLARVAQQEGQQLERLGLDGQMLAIPKQAVAGQVDG